MSTGSVGGPIIRSLRAFCRYLQHLVTRIPPTCKRNTRSRPEMSKRHYFYNFLVPAVPLGRWRYRGEGDPQ